MAKATTRPSSKAVVITPKRLTGDDRHANRVKCRAERQMVLFAFNKTKSQLRNVKTQIQKLPKSSNQNGMEQQWLDTELKDLRRKTSEQRKTLQNISRKQKKSDGRAMKSMLSELNNFGL
jgi:septal ring factor EnvC (AmiA/AmiB activator)